MTITTSVTLVGTAQEFVISTTGQLRGPPGPPGPAGGAGFTWAQSIALAVWTIPHNLARYPSVTVVDTTGSVVTPDIAYVDQNTIQITHGLPLAGSAYLN